MADSRQVWAGSTADANTPETDAMPEVRHHVSVRVLTDGVALEETVALYAKHPQDAMDKVRAMSDEVFSRLQRVVFPT